MTRPPILVGIDGSSGAAHALRWALDRAVSADSVLRVVTAWEMPALASIPLPADIGMPTEADMAALAVALLADAIAELGPDPGIVIERSVRHGRPGNAILEDAADSEPGLIVVGTHGRSTVARVLMGSVSRHVATHATVPVAVIPESAELGTTELVRVGVDNSPGGRAALDWVGNHTRCPIEVLHAWDAPHLYGVAEYPADEVERFADKMLETMVADVPALSDRDVRRRVKRGDPREVLVAATDSEDPSVGSIVLGRRNGGPLSALFGSVSMFVASHSPVPVIVVPPQSEPNTEKPTP